MQSYWSALQFAPTNLPVFYRGIPQVSHGITFTNMRRMCALFNKFEDCKGFAKELGAGKGVVKLIVDDSKNGIIRYNFKQ